MEIHCRMSTFLADLVLVPIPRSLAILLLTGVPLIRSPWNLSVNVTQNMPATNVMSAKTTILATLKYPEVHANSATVATIGKMMLKAIAIPTLAFVFNVFITLREIIANTANPDTMEMQSMMFAKPASATFWVRIPTNLIVIGSLANVIAWPTLKEKVAIGALIIIGALPEEKVASPVLVTWSVPYQRVVMYLMVNANAKMDLEEDNVTNAKKITMEIHKSNALLAIAILEFQNLCNAIVLLENVSVVKVIFNHLFIFLKVQTIRFTGLSSE